MDHYFHVQPVKLFQTIRIGVSQRGKYAGVTGNEVDGLYYR